MSLNQRVSVLLLCGAAATVSCQALGQQAGLSVEAGLGYSDNIGRDDDDKTDQTLASLGVTADLSRREGRLTGSMVGDLYYVNYLDNAYDDDIYGRADVYGAYAFVPDTFSWVVQDSFGQVRRNPLGRPNPGNQENVNYFSTGPDLTLRLGERGFLNLAGRYSLATYEESPSDYDSLSTWATLGRRLSEQSDIGVKAAGYWIEFDDQSFADDYDISEVSLVYNVAGSRTQISAEAGYTTLNYQDETNDGPLFRVSLRREVGAASSVTLRLGQEYTDPGRRFQNGGRPPGGPGSGIPNDTLNVGDPFQNRYAEFAWATDLSRTRLSVGVRYSDHEYQTRSDLDRQRWSIYGDWLRRVTERFSLRMRAVMEHEEYDDGSLDDDRLRFSAGVSWDVTPKTYLTFDWDYFKGDGNSVLRDYTENRLWLVAGHRFR